MIILKIPGYRSIILLSSYWYCYCIGSNYNINTKDKISDIQTHFTPIRIASGSVEFFAS